MGPKSDSKFETVLDVFLSLSTVDVSSVSYAKHFPMPGNCEMCYTNEVALPCKNCLQYANEMAAEVKIQVHMYICHNSLRLSKIQ